MNDLSPEPDISFGEIGITTHFDDEGRPTEYDYTWHGGDVIQITSELLEQAHPASIQWERDGGVEKITTGDIIKIGPYATEVINVDFERKIVFCLRMRAKEEEVNDK